MRPPSDEVAIRLQRVAGTKLHFSLVPLSGGASDRWYMRLTGALAEHYGCASLVVMGIAPELNAIFDSFLRIRRFLARNGIPVPKVYAEYLDEGIVFLEDFGDLPMTKAVRDAPARKAPLYEQALRLLALLHSCTDDLSDPCPAFQLHFDVAKYNYEFDFHVRRWVLGHYWGANLTPVEDAVLSRTFSWISRTLAAEPRVFTHRDYQTSNLMVRAQTCSTEDDPQGEWSLGLVDFQDARQGLRQYDLASLLYDSYVDLDDAERNRLVERYCELTAGRQATEAFRFLLRVAAIQRKLHDAGAFIYAAAHRGKSEYLAFVPETLTLAVNLMASIPECREASEILGDLAGRGGRQRMSP